MSESVVDGKQEPKQASKEAKESENAAEKCSARAGRGSAGELPYAFTPQKPVKKVRQPARHQHPVRS